MACARSKQGFTLVEALVALFILSVVAVFATIVAGTVPTARDAVLEQTAFRIAENKLNELRSAGYDSLPGSGVFSDPELGDLPGGMASTTVVDWNAGTKQVTAGVSWTGTQGAARYISLTTLMTDTGGL